MALGKVDRGSAEMASFCKETGQNGLIHDVFVR